MLQFIIKQRYLLLMVWLVLANLPGPARAQEPTPWSNCRLGVGGVSSDVVGYNFEQLNLGLYLDWTARAARPAGLPAGIEYIQTVRVHQVKGDYGSGWYGPPRVYAAPPAYQVKPDLGTLASMAANQPGSLWMIGNEIERVDWPEGAGWSGQDEITPELYATAFHDIQATIKAADPTARIAIGGIIQATPLRLAYLDRVWASYQAQYGYAMGQDIDVWNVHGFIIREVLNDWGAEIPAGFNNYDADPNNNYNPADAFLRGADYGTVLAAHYDMNYYRQFIRDFRGWMAAHGERNKPLINTEYGILMDLSNSVVIGFLEATFDYMFSATDEAIGFPADENRLLQGWAWYSLNDDLTYFAEGSLFNSSSKNLTAVGAAWVNYVTDPGNPLASQPQHNLLAANLRTDPDPTWTLPGATVTVSLKADIANSGNTGTSTGNNIVVHFWDGVPGGPGSKLIATRTLADMPGCGGFTTVTAAWSDRPVGDHPWYVQVLPIANETKTSDNIATGLASVIEGTPMFLHLPIILKH